jgi:preprotein translocase subunit YajC
MWTILILGYAALFGIAWLLFIKPRRDAQRRHADLVKGLKRGERVVTVGGIHGRIVTIRDKTIDLEIAEGTRVRFERAAVRKYADEETE